jgi:hypothetical protein
MYLKAPEDSRCAEGKMVNEGNISKFSRRKGKEGEGK